ncbi:hypothetical protein LWI29_000143 [Acer saccharum]|uniref:Zinc finger BED domain-containing protein RICESLEEPER 2-like n=1 Tax=Acer saccharum TaxID=4024 RepID=A0AA39SJF3_ACESA|nr:hypothetical protein LWI29_000143 [Acer saccharum]
MADSYHGTDNFTAPSEESKGLEFDTTQSMEEEEDNDVTQMGKEIVEYKSIPNQLFESGSEGGSSSDSDRKDPQVFQELVTAAIIMHDLPLRFFEWSHVRKMIEFVSDDVNLVSKETTEMDVLKVHRREKEVVKAMIEEAYGRVCLTAEWWTAMNTDNYIVEAKVFRVYQASLDCKKGLRQDIPTIWNSTYLMLENALYYRHAWCLLELFDINFKLCPSASEWDKVKKSIKFFGIFYEIACIFSRTKCPTSNMYFPKMLVALITLKQNLESEDVFLKKLTNQMYTKFYKYWVDSCTILAIAVILDPRYKMKFVEFAFEKVYGDGLEQLELVRKTLYSLFSEYMTNSTGTSTSKASFASGVTSTFTHGTSFVMKEFDSSLVSDDCIQKTQLELYLDEPRVDRSMDLDILSFWKVNEFRYPVLATMARDVLTIPISTVSYVLHSRLVIRRGRILNINKELTHSTENSAPNLVLRACRVC